MIPKVLKASILFFTICLILAFASLAFADSNDFITQSHILDVLPAGDKVILTSTGSSTVAGFVGSNRSLGMFNCPINYPYWRQNTAETPSCYKQKDLASERIQSASNLFQQANDAPDYYDNLNVYFSSWSTSTYPLQIIYYKDTDDPAQLNKWVGANTPDTDSVEPDFYLIWDYVNNEASEGYYNSQIISMVPENGTTTATSTTFLFQVDGYIAPEDLNDTQLSISYRNWSSEFTTPEEAINNTFTWYFTEAGFFSTTTTANLSADSDVGTWILNGSLTKDRLLLFREQLDYESNQFNIVQETDFDTLYSLPEFINGAIGTFEATLVWFRDEFLRRPPWGYGYRVYEILTLDTEVLPDPETTFIVPSGMGHLSGYEMNFDIWDGLRGISTTFASYDPINDPTNDNFYDISLYYWELLVKVSFGIWLMMRIFQSSGAGDFDFTSKSEKMYKETRRTPIKGSVNRSKARFGRGL